VILMMVMKISAFETGRDEVAMLQLFMPVTLMCFPFFLWSLDSD